MNRSSHLLLVLLAAALASLQLAPAAAQPAPPPAVPKAQAPVAPATPAPGAARPAADSAAAGGSSDAAADAAVAAMIAAAGAEGDHWLGLIDHGKFDESWTATAVVLQETITQKEWSADLTARQPKLGRMIMRERKTENYSKTLRGAPTGDYVILTYLTKFEKAPLVEETLAVAKDGIGQWHVAGYDIKLSAVQAP
ncbi:MAG TPA: DUF4019 domain-containing protein [Casimicrobiaceae bacterium]|jgi:hypothetical protein|nr:DUF4019 domain-containing protein [Casimicrobiaceae bacterium]